jgi:hypothetical protein
MNATRSHRVMKLWYVTVLGVTILTGLGVVGGMVGVLKVLLVFQPANPLHDVAAAVQHSEPSHE